mmetsp:Transcript_29089/g.53019  ORF Transcript_29089/g.53019 Transcript_29089/m.53019 type:complete len:215 (-) Transcript_29089:66-710(-)
MAHSSVMEDLVIHPVSKAAAVTSMVLLYLQFTDAWLRALALCASLAFAVVETTWLSITNEGPDGEVELRRPFALGHSSFAQFWMNILYTPILLQFYRSTISAAWLRVALFPLNIWLLEVVEGYALIALVGKNIAWSYRGWDAYFDGNIKLLYFFPWLGLGAVVEMSWDIILTPVASAMSPHYATILMFIAFLTLFGAPELRLAILRSSPLKKVD